MDSNVLLKSLDKTNLHANIDTPIKKTSFNNKVELTFDDKINLLDTTENFISKSQSKCESRLNQLLQKNNK